MASDMATVEITVHGVSNDALLAVAYMDLNSNGVFDADQDNLIAKVVDVDNSGTVTAGDQLIAEMYPTTLGQGTPADMFQGNNGDPVVLTLNGNVLAYTAGEELRVEEASLGYDYSFFNSDTLGADRFFEEASVGGNPLTVDILDRHTIAADRIVIGNAENTGEASLLTGSSDLLLSLTGGQAVDNDFLEVDVFI